MDIEKRGTVIVLELTALEALVVMDQLLVPDDQGVIGTRESEFTTALAQELAQLLSGKKE